MATRYLSGIQATGIPHIGNYIGAIKAWVKSQNEEVEAFYMIADLHAITVPVDAEVLRQNRLGAMAGLLACGLDPSRVALFFQSAVPQHAELAWILSSHASLGELRRMTQFKAKSSSVKDSANLALFSYPVLQAADVLLYQTDVVPVGEDQLQHIELCRNIALRVNGKYGEVFRLPRAVVPPIGGRIMDLQDPSKKMSKSGNASMSGVISLTDTDDEISHKISRAVTDSENRIAFSESQPGLGNLLTLFAALDDRSIDAVVADFSGRGYGPFKKALTERVVATVSPIRQRIQTLLSDLTNIEAELRPSTVRALGVAERTLSSVKSAVGF